MDMTTQQRRLAYDRLMRGYDALGGWAPAEDRWTWLMAAHVVGQQDLRLHLRSHWRMLGLALATRDAPEVAGQVFRLVLVPLGHGLQRLPTGNVGRATVNAFRPMTPDDRVRRLIAMAVRS